MAWRCRLSRRRMREGQSVIITFLEDEPQRSDAKPNVDDADSLAVLLARCEVDTGITDLAAQHDHYFYSTPKK